MFLNMLSKLKIIWSVLIIICLSYNAKVIIGVVLLFVLRLNIIKMRLVYPVLSFISIKNVIIPKIFGFSYERVISKKRTFNISMDIGRIFMDSNFGEGKSLSNGISLYPEYRFYPFKKKMVYPTGFHIGPALAFGVFGGWNEIYGKTYSTINNTIVYNNTLAVHSDFKVVTVGVGAVLGWQYFIGKRKRFTMSHSFGLYVNKNFIQYESPVITDAFRMYPENELSYTPYFATYLGYTFGKVEHESQSGEKGEKYKWIIGVQGAPSIVVWYGNKDYRKLNNIQYQPKLVFSEGIRIQYNAKPRFAICIEANYERKGSMEVHPGNLKYDYTTDYLIMPVMTKFKLNKKNIGVYGSTGVFIGYLLKYNWSNSSNEIKIEENPDNYYRLDMGVVTGLGVDVPLGNHLNF